MVKTPIEIAAYYFPNYHKDPRNAARHGPDWTEWELMRRAEPRFQGHRQPVIPAWGYQDESDPKVMAQKIACAADHGIDVFIFDWYYYEDGPFLEGALERGFLKTPNRERIKFALMWANHTWIDIHPAKASPSPNDDAPIQFPGEVSLRAFREITKRCVEKYFCEPNYWKINGCPYFSIYDLSRFLTGLGGVENAREAILEFRELVKNAGFPDLHLNAVLWQYTILPGEVAIADPHATLQQLGVDSYSSYVWVHHVEMRDFPCTSYFQMEEEYHAYWDNVEKQAMLPYLPNVTMGWDPSPRTVPSDSFRPLGYPFTPILEHNSPENFGSAVAEALKRIASTDRNLKALTINAWNEWTEGSYLEPDTHHGLGYLEALREAKSRFVQDALNSPARDEGQLVDC